jgi:hypothetical protein
MNTLSTDVGVDHVVFYAAHGLAELASFFERAGFQLTATGRHNSGSVNRLAMLAGQYIELMGFEPGTPATVRPEIQAMPIGLNGIVAADRAGRDRRYGNDAFLPAVHLERPVDTPQVKGTAAFTITNARDGAADVRTFMCRHHTPDLVWHTDWQVHPNGAVGVGEVRITTQHPRRVHDALRRIFDIEPGEDAAAYDAAGTRIEVLSAGERPTLVVRTRDMQAAQEVLRRSGVAHSRQGPRVVVPLPAPYVADLVFEPAA